MDAGGEATFANRDEPIPILRIPANRNDADSVDDEEHRSRRRAIKDAADKVKDRLGHAKDETRSLGMQDRLLNSIFAQILPSDDSHATSQSIDPRSSKYVERPSFSLPAMSTNFRRFNSRIGIVFVFQNRLIRLFTWRIPTHTLSFLASYTLLCLQPSLLPALPLALIFFFVMIPSFLTRHPPPPYPTESSLISDPASATEMESAWASYAYTSTPTAPPRRVRPAPEMSKDFFRNMRDLQNSMEDFSRLHDGAIATISPYTDFSDERLSSSVFLAIFVLLSVATVGAHLVPWRLVAVLVGWGITGAGHPKAQDALITLSENGNLKEWVADARKWALDWVESDIALDEPPEVREVEIFELQRRQKSDRGDYLMPSPTSAAPIVEKAGRYDEEWEPWLFCPAPHDPLSPARLSGAWPTGTQFFEDVKAPNGWNWKDKKWTLDLLSEAWVEERCVTGVEVEREGARWVYDMGEGASRVNGSWEEGSGQGSRGEWRRRRWVRLVERKGETKTEEV